MNIFGNGTRHLATDKIRPGSANKLPSVLSIMVHGLQISIYQIYDIENLITFKLR